MEWWEAFRGALLKSKVVTSAHTLAPRSGFGVALGLKGIHLSNIADTYANRIGVRVYIRNIVNAEAALSQLSDHKAEIESEIGEPLVWNANPEGRDKIIAIYHDADLSDREKWPPAPPARCAPAARRQRSPRRRGSGAPAPRERARWSRSGRGASRRASWISLRDSDGDERSRVCRRHPASHGRANRRSNQRPFPRPSGPGGSPSTRAPRSRLASVRGPRARPGFRESVEVGAEPSGILPACASLATTTSRSPRRTPRR